MTRENWLRPVGNPVNLDEQPKEPLEFNWRATGSKQTWKFLTRIFLGTLLLALLPSNSQQFWSLLVTGDPIWICVIIIIGLRLVAWLEIPLSWYLAAAYIVVSHLFIPIAFNLALLTLLFPLQVRWFGLHYRTICSAAPLPPDVAKKFRESGQLPAGVKLVSVVMGISDSIHCWLFYNRHGHNAAGICESSVGSQSFRMLNWLITFTLLLSVFNDSTSSAGILANWIGGISIASGLGVVIVLLNLNSVWKSYSVKCHATLSTCWPSFVEKMASSTNSVERDSVFQGQVRHDGSPILNPTNILRRHQWLCGSSGSGKTTYLMMLIDQLIGKGFSVLCIDLKADSFELLHTMRGSGVPVKHLSNRLGDSSYLFSPFRQKWWGKLSVGQRSDVLLSSAGLLYSRSYGESYFTDVNYKLLDFVLSKYPGIGSFQELHERLGYEIANAMPSELSAHTKRDGEHVALIIDRIAKTEFFDIDSGDLDQQQHQLQLDELFTQQSLIYAGLNCLIAPSASPEIARVLFGSTLACATSIRQRTQELVIVIDEFQQMTAPGTLQLAMRQARSLGCSIILANQTVGDLKSGKNDFTPTIESNTATQIWFKAGSRDAFEQIQTLGGKVIDHLYSRSISDNPNGTTTTVTRSEVLVDRLQTGDIADVSADPSAFIIRISEDQGYAQYSGLPFAARYDYHLTWDEYKSRTDLPWPPPCEETMINLGQTSHRSAPGVVPKTGPVAPSATRSRVIGQGSLGQRPNPKQP